METIFKNIPFLSDLLDAIPSNIFVFDRDLRIVFSNAAASNLTGRDPEKNVLKLCGEAINCLNSVGYGLECGKTPFCDDCVLRKSIENAFLGKKSNRTPGEFTLIRNQKSCRINFKISAFPLRHNGDTFVVAILDDDIEISELRALLPICAWCKKIRDDQDYWHRVEDYLSKHMDIQTTHGICPECRSKFDQKIPQG